MTAVVFIFVSPPCVMYRADDHGAASRFDRDCVVGLDVAAWALPLVELQPEIRSPLPLDQTLHALNPADPQSERARDSAAFSEVSPPARRTPQPVALVP